MKILLLLIMIALSTACGLKNNLDPCNTNYASESYKVFATSLKQPILQPEDTCKTQGPSYANYEVRHDYILDDDFYFEPSDNCSTDAISFDASSLSVEDASLSAIRRQTCPKSTCEPREGTSEEEEEDDEDREDDDDDDDDDDNDDVVDDDDVEEEEQQRNCDASDDSFPAFG